MKQNNRFALILHINQSNKTKEIIVMVNPNIIYEAIFKNKETNKWEFGFGLAVGQRFEFLFPFSEWKKALTCAKELKIEGEKEEYILTKDDLESIKEQILSVDKRIKINN